MKGDAMADRSYEDGVRDGEIKALSDMVRKHGDRLDIHSQRIGRIERLSYIALGGLIVLQFIPTIKGLLTSLP